MDIKRWCIVIRWFLSFFSDPRKILCNRHATICHARNITLAISCSASLNASKDRYCGKKPHSRLCKRVTLFGYINRKNYFATYWLQTYFFMRIEILCYYFYVLSFSMDNVATYGLYFLVFLFFRFSTINFIALFCRRFHRITRKYILSSITISHRCRSISKGYYRIFCFIVVPQVSENRHRVSRMARINEVSLYPKKR